MDRLCPTLDPQTAGQFTLHPQAALNARQHRISELPSSYKKADRVISQIAEYGLADIVDCIDPYGCIMAGDLPPAWQKGKQMRR